MKSNCFILGLVKSETIFSTFETEIISCFQAGVGTSKLDIGSRQNNPC